MNINTTNELNKKMILVEYDAGYIDPSDKYNHEIIKESKDFLDHSKPFEFYAVLQKYGTDLDRNDLELEEWLEHSIQEKMDDILYIQKALIVLREAKNTFIL